VFTFWETAKPFSKVAVVFYFPTSNVTGPIVFMTSSGLGIVNFTIMVSVCTSQRTDYVKYVFMFLEIICLSNLEKCIIKSSVHFQNWIVFLWSLKNSLYILNTRSLPDIQYNLQIFPLSLWLALSFFKMMSLKSRSLILVKSNLSFFFFFVGCTFCVRPYGIFV
jgi:hypothetical protein